MSFQDYSAALTKQPAPEAPVPDVNKPAEAPAGFKAYSTALQKPKESTGGMPSWFMAQPKAEDLARVQQKVESRAAIADLILGIPAQLVSVGADIGARGYATGAGESRRTGAQAGGAAANWVMENNPLSIQKILQAVGYTKEPDKNTVNKVMQKVGDFISRGGAQLEHTTGEVVLKEDVESLFNEITAVLGVKGSEAAAPKALKARAALDGSLERPAAPEKPTASLLKPSEKPPTTEQPPAFADEAQLGSWLRAEGDKAVTKPRIKGPPATMGEPGVFQNGTSGEASPSGSVADVERMRQLQSKTYQQPGGLYDPNVPPLPGTPDIESLRARKPEDAMPGHGDPNFVPDEKSLAEFKARIEKISKEKGLKGNVDPALVARMAAASGGALLGAQVSDDKLVGALTGALTLGAIPMGEGVRSRFKQSGAIKEGGGFWHPATVARVADPLKSHAFEDPANALADRMASNYLNKHAGTAKDPLKDIEIPARALGQDTVTWGEAWDKAVDAKSASTFKYRVPKEIMGKKYFEDRQTFPDIPQDSIVWHYGSAHRDALGAQRAIHDYLSHVGDYLRTVPAEKLKQYDLVRAVKETDAADKRAATAMEKEAAKATAQLPVVKEYPDGVKWVEIKAPEKLTPEQREGIGESTQDRTSRKIPYQEKVYYPLDEKGDVMRSRFTGREVDPQPNPERAWLAGRLTEEGNALGHCVGGYCEGVASGDSRIFSLRDERGRSHVTVEVKPDKGVTGGGARKRFPDDGDITQIRGAQNRAPADKYVPYVQDLIRSGKWGKVYELDNARLMKGENVDLSDWQGKIVEPEKIGLDTDKYYTESEVTKAITEGQEKGLFKRAQYRRMPQGRQGGAVDVRLLRSLAAASLGVAAGAYLDPENPLTGAVLGAGVGLGVVNGRAVVNALSHMAKDTRVRVDHLADHWEGMIKQGALNVYRVQQHMSELAPRGDFVKITKFLEGDKTVQLTPEEAQAARVMLNVLVATQKAGISAGVMSNALENYMRRVWLDNRALQAYMNAPKAGSTLYQGMRQTNKAPTIAEGKAAGLKPISEDARHLLGVYVNSVVRSIAARDMVSSLKAFRDPAGEAVVRPAKGAPMGWVRINSPHLMGSVVHPDIAPSIRFVLENSDPGKIMKGLEGVNLAVKRLNVSFSLFHAKALLDAYIGAGGDVTKLGGIARGTDRFLQGLKKVDPDVEKYIQLSRRNGLEFSLEGVASDDVRTTKAGFKALQNWMDTIVPGMGSLGRAVEHVNALSDRFMWERLHAGMKLNIFTKEFDRLQKSNAAAHAKNPAVALMGEDEIAKIASSYTNDLFGGLNWRRVAESMNSRFGRDLALELFKPSNRRIMQLLVFAPDWTLSTFRAAAGSLAGGLKGTPLSRMHRMYMVRSAIYYIAIADAINYPLTGHHIWQNKDPTRIDLGNGQTMQWSKHFTEPFHWFTQPIQQGLNKVGIIPKTVANFALGTEYLSSQGHSPKAQGGRFSRLARQALPISAAQQFEAGPEAGIAGFFGVPIYGKSIQQREQEKLKRQLEHQIHPTPQQLEKRLGRTSSADNPDSSITYGDTPKAEWEKQRSRLGESPVTNSRELAERRINKVLKDEPNISPEQRLQKNYEYLKDVRKRKVPM